MSASETLAQYSPLVLNGEGMVLPELKDIQKVSAQLVCGWQNAARRGGETSAEALQQPLTIISGKPNTATTAVPPSSLRPVKVTGYFLPFSDLIHTG